MTDDKYGKIHTDGSRSGGQPLNDSIEAKALALVNEMRQEHNLSPLYNLGLMDYTAHQALCRAIEQHEAFKQEVSDAVGDTLSMLETHCDAEGFVFASNQLLRFIIPKPKPDPLVDVAKSLGYFNTAAQHWAGDVRAALDALGFEIREKESK
jgi:hypothetical protein